MGIRASNVIGNSARISKRSSIETDNAQRHKFDTDYDPMNPPVVSDEKSAVKFGRRCAVRYRYVKTCGLYRAEVIGPFHSKLYGACAFGRSKVSAKVRLKHQLERNFGFIGAMLLSDKDEADTVGYPDVDLVRPNASASPINHQDLCGTAGQ